MKQSFASIRFLYKDVLIKEILGMRVWVDISEYGYWEGLCKPGIEY